MKQILILAAHPDDETLGVGGTILNYVMNGARVSVLILADGVTARHNQIELQKQASIKATKILGVENVFFGELPDQKLDSLPLIDIIRPINGLIQDIKPEIIYTHNGGDVNQDHRVVFEATMVAVRPVNRNPVKEVYCYEVASSTEWAPPLDNWGFKPNVFVNIEKFVEKKIEALLSYSETYKTEIPPYPHPRSERAVRIYAAKRGIEVGVNYAEAFMLIRKIE